MHKVAIPQTIVDRVIKRRGKEHVFEISIRRGPH